MGRVRNQGGLIAGIILVIIGIAFLLINLGVFGPAVFTIALGISFLIAFLFIRSLGFLIPGMILLWLGIATSLVQAHIFKSAVEPSIILLALGLAFVSIYAFMGRRRHWWPLIPGGILLLFGVGGLLVAQNVIPFTTTQVFNVLWSAALIIVGIWLIFRQFIRR